MNEHTYYVAEESNGYVAPKDGAVMTTDLDKAMREAQDCQRRFGDDTHSYCVIDTRGHIWGDGASYNVDTIDLPHVTTPSELALSLLYGDLPDAPMSHADFLALVERRGLSTAFLERFLHRSYGSVKKYLYEDVPIPAKLAKRLRMLDKFLSEFHAD